MRDNDYRLVLDIRTGMEVLSFGLELDETTVLANGRELGSAHHRGPYDRIICDWRSASDSVLERLVRMSSGLIAVRVTSTEDEVAAAAWFRRSHPFEECWRFASDIGRLIVSTATGGSRFRV